MRLNLERPMNLLGSCYIRVEYRKGRYGVELFTVKNECIFVLTLLIHSLKYKASLSFYVIFYEYYNMKQILTFAFPLVWFTFLTIFSLFYKRIRALHYFRWLPSNELEPEHSIQRPSNDQLDLAERGSRVGQETGNASNRLADDTSVRTSSFERSDEGCVTIPTRLLFDSTSAWRQPESNTTE